MGGLDLTNGRFDTPTHSLFRTLASTHQPPDFHQACVTVGPTKGPREPWHDQAGHVSAGAASWDVLQNFTERWRRQAGSEEHALADISGREYVSAEEEEANGRRRRGAWNVQILRSINEASAVFEDAKSPGLFTRRRALIDQSIHHAYVHHVRRSKRFCFFENQYCTFARPVLFLYCVWTSSCGCASGVALRAARAVSRRASASRCQSTQLRSSLDGLLTRLFWIPCARSFLLLWDPGTPRLRRARVEHALA